MKHTQEKLTELFAYAVDLFNETMDEEYAVGEGGIMLRFFTPDNGIQVYEDFCSIYFPHHLKEDYNRREKFENISAEAFVSEQYDGVMIRADLPFPEMELIQIFLHETAHIYCTHNEINGGNFYREYCDAPDHPIYGEILNEDSIKSYRSRFELIRSGHTWNTLPNNEFLMKIGAAKISEMDGKVHPTLGGLVFFGNFINIMDELPDFFLDYREKLSTETRWSDRVCSGDGDWSGNVYDFYFKIIDRLTSDVKKPFAINADLLRDDDTPIHKSIREALANALIHADYYGRQGIVIEKEFRKLKLSNPGTFRISVDDAISGGISDARNGRIFNMFSLIKVGERSGMGLCDLYTNWKNSGYEKPVIEETIEPDRITLTLQIEIVTSGRDSENGRDNVIDNGRDSENGRDNVIDKILNEIKNDDRISVAQIARNIKVSERTVGRHIKTLKEAEVLVREGTKNGKWIILK